MGGWLLFAIFLYVACAALIVAEVFIPSGGLLSICALACVVGGVAIFFRISSTAGWLGIVVAVVMIPLLLVGAYRLLPKTRFGRNVILSGPVRERGDAIPDTAELLKLLGQVGRVLTPLRPVGTCDFSGRRVECVAEAGYVQKGATVKVIRVEGTQLTVRVIDEA
ncbi:MAG TPA: NfeD family protein [Sedimentisphaerales bacterium]|nr:NfeD family protein [Sedimentisphaerales bacterium]HRS12023.1 NfeD family protein [Sedimentisphaerales bacterium]HRV48544.1 NfeD family protein [Sedimentisphaerales bacterium]